MWADLAETAKKGAGVVVGVLRSRWGRRFLGAMAWLRSLVPLLSQWVDLWESPGVLHSSLGRVFGVGLFTEGTQEYLLFCFFSGLLFPSNQGGETTRETLEKTPLLFLLRTWLWPQIRCVLIV